MSTDEEDKNGLRRVYVGELHLMGHLFDFFIHVDSARNLLIFEVPLDLTGKDQVNTVCRKMGLSKALESDYTLSQLIEETLAMAAYARGVRGHGFLLQKIKAKLLPAPMKMIAQTPLCEDATPSN